MKRYTGIGALVAAAVLSAAMPFVPMSSGAAEPAEAGFPGWPATYEGRVLTALPLSERETGFLKDFPGRVGRFTDGEREIVLRTVVGATRRLHPASDCYRGLGFAIEPRPLQVRKGGVAMGCFRARKAGETIEVCETIKDGAGRVWPDVSAWYWDALLGRSAGPWWSTVVARRLTDPAE